MLDVALTVALRMQEMVAAVLNMVVDASVSWNIALPHLKLVGYAVCMVVELVVKSANVLILPVWKVSARLIIGISRPISTRSLLPLTRTKHLVLGVPRRDKETHFISFLTVFVLSIFYSLRFLFITCNTYLFFSAMHLFYIYFTFINWISHI